MKMRLVVLTVGIGSTVSVPTFGENPQIFSEEPAKVSAKKTGPSI